MFAFARTQATSWASVTFSSLSRAHVPFASSWGVGPGLPASLRRRWLHSAAFPALQASACGRFRDTIAGSPSLLEYSRAQLSPHFDKAVHNGRVASLMQGFGASPGVATTVLVAAASTVTGLVRRGSLAPFVCLMMTTRHMLSSLARGLLTCEAFGYAARASTQPSPSPCHGQCCSAPVLPSRLMSFGPMCRTWLKCAAEGSCATHDAYLPINSATSNSKLAPCESSRFRLKWGLTCKPDFSCLAVLACLLPHFPSLAGLHKASALKYHSDGISASVCCRLEGGRRRDINYGHQSIVHVQNAGMLACDTTGPVTSLQSPT